MPLVGLSAEARGKRTCFGPLVAFGGLASRWTVKTKAPNLLSVSWTPSTSSTSTSCAS